MSYSKTSHSICFIFSPLPLVFNNLKHLKNETFQLVIGDYDVILKELQRMNVTKYHFIEFAHNSIMPLKSHLDQNYRVEYGAVVRDNTFIEENAVILMGAIINVGAKIGKNTMVDMNAVIGSNAQIGSSCHIGAGAVIAGTMEPFSSKPVIIGDNTFIGANSVILEGISIGNNVIIGAGSIVTKDIPNNVVCYGNPCKIRRITNEIDTNKIDLSLR